MGYGDQAVLDLAEAVLTEAGATVWAPSSSAYPMIVAHHPRWGLLVVDVPNGDLDAMVALNRKLAALRESVPGLRRVSVARRLIDPRVDRSTDSVVAARELHGGWISTLPRQPSDPTVPELLEVFFAPRLSIDVPVRRPLSDPGAADRATGRIQLDEKQAGAAQRRADGILAVTGPPGSGKTLVLCARANWFAADHPDWDIRILCFNRLLVPYLQLLTSGAPNVRVSTVGKFCGALGVRMSLTDPERAKADLDVARLRGLGPSVDAVLIDEWQDFFPAWTALAELVLRPGRGGMMVAGDPKQALYHEVGMSAGVTSSIETLVLNIPYRSTRQILEVTSALGSGLDVAGRERAFDGEPVDLVWATSAAEQAHAVARDVLLLLESGERLPQDVGVLVTRKWSIGGVARALSEVGVPCRPVYANQADDLDLAEPSVKVITVHSAKGLEFDVVFLVGLEQLPDPAGTADIDRQGRTAYVGATRARDQLILSYSKDNAYLERIRALPEDILRRWVWPDDYPEA
jgi:hypothetical protein